MEDTLQYQAFRVFMQHWLHPNYKAVCYQAQQKKGLVHTRKVLRCNRLLRKTTSHLALFRHIKALSYNLLSYDLGARNITKHACFTDILLLYNQSGKVTYIFDVCKATNDLEFQLRSPVSDKSDELIAEMNDDEIRRVSASMVFPKWT